MARSGHDREPCFFGEEDYQACLHWLGEAVKEERCALLAHTPMTSHVHLLIAPRQAARVTQLDPGA